MVSNYKTFDFGRRRGHCVMEVTVFLILCIPLTAAIAIQHTNRHHTDTLSLKHRIRRSDSVASVDPLGEMPATTAHYETLDTTPRQSLMHRENILKRALARLRRRRASTKGCQLGTCQMHNLANTLYRMGQTSGKEQSKGAGDPNGYGR